MDGRLVKVDGTIFEFPGEWTTVQFDELPQFTRVAGHLGVKGCDVAAVGGDVLWIIEMKDYTYPDAKVPGDLVTTVGLKAVGTMAVLYSLERQYAESGAKTFALVASRTTSIVLALHVDVPEAKGHSKLGVGPLASMKQQLDRVKKSLGLSRVIVTSTLVPDAQAPWKARRDPKTRSRHITT